MAEGEKAKAAKAKGEEDKADGDSGDFYFSPHVEEFIHSNNSDNSNKHQEDDNNEAVSNDKKLKLIAPFWFLQPQPQPEPQTPHPHPHPHPHSQSLYQDQPQLSTTLRSSGGFELKQKLKNFRSIIIDQIHAFYAKQEYERIVDKINNLLDDPIQNKNMNEEHRVILYSIMYKSLLKLNRPQQALNFITPLYLNKECGIQDCMSYGLTLFRLQRYQESIESFARAVSICPLHITAWTKLANSSLSFSEKIKDDFSLGKKTHDSDCSLAKGEGRRDSHGNLDLASASNEHNNKNSKATQSIKEINDKFFNSFYPSPEMIIFHFESKRKDEISDHQYNLSSLSSNLSSVNPQDHSVHPSTLSLTPIIPPSLIQFDSNYKLEVNFDLIEKYLLSNCSCKRIIQLKTLAWLSFHRADQIIQLQDRENLLQQHYLSRDSTESNRSHIRTQLKSSPLEHFQINQSLLDQLSKTEYPRDHLKKLSLLLVGSEELFCARFLLSSFESITRTSNQIKYSKSNPQDPNHDQININGDDNDKNTIALEDESNEFDVRSL